MEQAFVHWAEVQLEDGADPAAPGGAVTLALCGSWDHPGPCRWPHETSVEWTGLDGRVRVVFVSTPGEENLVRALIGHALAEGRCVGPDGKVSHWVTTGSGPGVPGPEEERWRGRVADPANRSFCGQ